MANHLPFRVQRGPAAHFLPVSDFKAALEGRTWAKVGKNTFLLENEKGKIHLFELQKEAIYDFDFYENLPENAPFELLNGKLFFMPSPKFTHQKISHKLTLRLGNFVEQNDLGELLAAPFTVRLDKKNGPQPDLLFISKARVPLVIVEDKMIGAPDLAIEIASRSTQKKDRTEKKEVYARFGVREYWIVFPEKKTVEFYENAGGELVLTATLGEGDALRSAVLAGFEMPLASLF